MRLHKAIPALPVQDIGKAVAFYHEKLGFSCDVEKDDFARIVRDGVAIDLWLASDRRWQAGRVAAEPSPIVSGAESFLCGTASCRIEVTGIDELFAEYREREVLYDADTVVEITAWGTREFPALDLERNLLTFYE